MFARSDGPGSVNEATTVLGEYCGGAKILAGGQGLMPTLAMPLTSVN